MRAALMKIARLLIGPSAKKSSKKFLIDPRLMGLFKVTIYYFLDLPTEPRSEIVQCPTLGFFDEVDLNRARPV